MKKFLTCILIGLIIFSSIIPVFAEDVTNQPLNTYTVEYKHMITNKSDKTMNIEVELMSLLNDTASYYSLLKETTVKGSHVYKGQHSAFTYIFKNVNPKQETTLEKEYTVKLLPIDYAVNSKDIEKGELKGYNMYLNEEQYILTNDKLIKQKAKEIVGNEENPYKKAELIYKYIVKNMKYNKKSPINNSGSYSAIRDVLRGTEKQLNEDIKKGLVYNEKTQKYEEKTFNQQQGGICFEYATLFAAMLRSEGIPARVPVGFVVTSDEVVKLKKVGSIDISENAHAWVEFYIEPYGWVIADPTITGITNSTPDNIILQNFGKTNNFYIKQGYSYPSMQHKVPDNVIYNHEVILKVYQGNQRTNQDNGSNVDIDENMDDDTQSREDEEYPSNQEVIQDVDLSKAKFRILNRKKIMNNYYEKVQSTLDKEGILSYIDSNIVNNVQMTRGESAAIMYAITEGKGKYNEIKWKDIEGHWSEDMAKELSKHRILIGYKDNTVKPDKYVSEGDIQILVKRIFNENISQPISTLVKNFIQLLKTLI
ncbi:transglutaminase-like domain-containing protein [Alkaliphilus sp. B6464]|uniref:transglutaminase-like domain-containing protein n=1 Tax=Alkaliphilus sp. B6464 TaxID=2731219 RepID=UPI001BA83F04|nr:transglutaminase-like domain-containing protein [Alkaliphilus sp. B6464]QUH22138.1 hypothetical protein HYG84_19720 [Alkaliphilus sp. B6464]